MIIETTSVRTMLLSSIDRYKFVKRSVLGEAVTVELSSEKATVLSR